MQKIESKWRMITEFAFFAGVTIVIVILNKSITNESLLLAVLIFGIYLIVSGRISKLKFMDLEIMIKDAKSQPLKDLTEEFRINYDSYIETSKEGGVTQLKEIIVPELIRQANN